MNEFDLIRKQIKTINDLRSNGNPLLKEQIREIKTKYLINEDIDSPLDTEKYNVPNAVEDSIENDLDKEKPNEVKQSYRISGGVLAIHGDSKQDVELTTDDKKTFQETMDEFVNEVSDLVNFNQLNIYKDNVDWSGKIVDFDTDFYFTIGENNGIYITNEMTKVDENFLDLINKLQTYYEKFKSKWAKIIASRKKTKPE
jgi:hypothetical protein